MTDYTVARGGPDWASRIMAFGGMLMAGAALYYTYHLQLTSQQPPLKPDNTIQAALKPTGDGSIEANLANEPGDAAETSVADHVGQTPDRNPISWDDPTNQGSSNIDSPVAKQESPASEPASTDHLDRLDDLLDQPIDPPVEEAPRLVEVRTTFRPNGQPESVTTVIRNAGDGAAQISEVLFRPNDVVELPQGASRPDWSNTDESQLVVFFDDADNLSVTDGKHGSYVRSLPMRFTLAAGNAANINLAIKNSSHTGWGLQGRLTLRLINGDDHNIDDVTLAFVE